VVIASFRSPWREASGHTFLGRLEFSAAAFILEGRDGSESAVKRTSVFQELSGFHLAQTAGERTTGCLIGCPASHVLDQERVRSQSPLTDSNR
jgi:hypothetical protein